MDERTPHEEDELLNTEEDDSTDTDLDDDTTPDGEDKGKETAEEVKARQKEAWKKKIDSGEKTLDDLPPHLGWLKEDIKKDLEPDKKTVKKDDLEGKIDKALSEREALKEFNDLVDDLGDADITAEQDAQLKEEYEDLLSDFENPTASQQLKALTKACRLAGVKSIGEITRERRRKGRVLPPFGTRKRTTVEKDKQTEMEKRLGGNLPPGYKA